MRSHLQRSAAAAALIALVTGAPSSVRADDPDVITGGEMPVPRPAPPPSEGASEASETPDKYGDPAEMATPLEPGWEEVGGIADVGYRTASFVFSLIGPPIFVMGTPVSLISGGVDGLKNSWNELAWCPIRFTFVDPWRRHKICPERAEGS